MRNYTVYDAFAKLNLQKNKNMAYALLDYPRCSQRQTPTRGGKDQN